MPDWKIAVIGAGAAGLTAAHQLKKRGYHNTTVFEKSDTVGGKVSTYFHEGRPYEIGAVWTTSDYETINGLCRELKVPRHPVNQLNLMTPHGTVQNLVSYVLRNYNLLSFSKDIFKFWKLCMRHPNIKRPGFKGLHPDFHLTLDELALKHGFPATARIMAPTMSACGYGFYEEVPAQYWMKLMTILLNFAARGGQTLRNLKSFSNGYQSLWTTVAQGLDVRVNSHVTCLARKKFDSGDKIEITANGKTEVFDKVIVAAPLETAHTYMDLSDNEQDLFAKIRTLRYIVTVASADAKVHTAFAKNITPKRLGHVNAALKFHEDTDVCVYFQMVEDSTSSQQALKVLDKDLAEVGIRMNEIFHQKEWSYFPHVDKNELQNGYNDKIEALQGERGTYYTGSLLSFETVEHTSAYSKDLVERFF